MDKIEPVSCGLYLGALFDFFLITERLQNEGVLGS